MASNSIVRGRHRDDVTKDGRLGPIGLRRRSGQEGRGYESAPPVEHVQRRRQLFGPLHHQ